MYDSLVHDTKTTANRGVRAEGLGKRYDDLWALRDLDLNVAPGTVLGLLGHNGAGKTTAIRILTTLAIPTEGSGSVAGFDVVHQADEVRRRIGVAAQEATVDGLLTGRFNLEMVGRLYGLPKGEARQRAGELLEQLDLVDAADTLVKTFSGGMRRRLDLAASLVGRPSVLFLDEPTTGLDPKSRNGLWDQLRDLVRDGTTVILTTQYLEEADRLSDDIVVLDHGRTVAHGTPEELKAQIGTDRIDVTVAERVGAGRGRRCPLRARLRRTLDRRRPARRHGADRRRHAAHRPRARPRRRRHRRRRRRSPPVHPRRRVPHPHHVRPEPRREPRMTATLTPTAEPATTAGSARHGSLVSESIVFARRRVEHIRQLPEKLLDVTLQPLMFVLLFTYVFGGAIGVEGGNYREYLIGGILIQTLAFGMVGPAMSIATDLTEGVVDRFRSLPVRRTAYLVGHWIAELSGMALATVLILTAGFVVGWRTHAGPPRPRHRGGAHPRLRRRHGVGRHLRRPPRADAGRRDGRGLHHDLPPDVHQQRLRADRLAAQLPAVGGEREPGERDRCRRPHAVRQPGDAQPEGRVAARPPGAGRLPLHRGPARARHRRLDPSLPPAHHRLSERSSARPGTNDEHRGSLAGTHATGWSNNRISSSSGG